MPSNFSTRFQARHSRLEKRFGELVRIVPRVPGRYTDGADDNNRAQRELRAIIHENPTDLRTDGAAVDQGNFGVKLQGERMMAHFPVAAFATQDDWPRTDDRLIRLEVPGQPVFEIVKASPDGVAEVVCPLVEVRE